MSIKGCFNGSGAFSKLISCIFLTFWSMHSFAAGYCDQHTCNLVRTLNLQSSGDFVQDDYQHECYPKSSTYIPSTSGDVSTENNVFAVDDQPLKIVSFKTVEYGCDNPNRNIATGRFISKQSLKELYNGLPKKGYIEFEVNFGCIDSTDAYDQNKCQGLWPGLWFVPTTFSWPLGSELDVVEINYSKYQGNVVHSYMTTQTIPLSDHNPELNNYQAGFKNIDNNEVEGVFTSMASGSYSKVGIKWECNTTFSECDFYAMLDGREITVREGYPTFSVYAKNKDMANYSPLSCNPYEAGYKYIGEGQTDPKVTKLCDPFDALMKGFPDYKVIMTQHVQPELYKNDPGTWLDVKGVLKVKSINLYSLPST